MHVLLPLLFLLGAPIRLAGFEPDCARPAADARFALDLVDLPLGDAAKLVACFTGRNLVMKAPPGGTVTVIGPTPVRAATVARVLRGALEEGGHTLSERGGHLQLLPAERGGPLVKRAPAEPRRVTVVARLEHVAADAVLPLVADFASPKAKVVAVADEGLLVISERADNLRRVMRLLKHLDAPSVRPNMRAYRIEHAELSALSSHLGALLDDRARLVTDERTGQLFVVATPPVHVQVARALAALDVPPGGYARGMRVLDAKHLKAEDLTRLIEGMRPHEGGARAPVRAPPK